MTLIELELQTVEQEYAVVSRLARETETFIGTIEARVYRVMDAELAMAAGAGQ